MEALQLARGESPDLELNVRQTKQHSAAVVDPAERENLRAQSSVAMYREPANRAATLAYPIWRLQLSSPVGASARLSGFELELQKTSRLSGLGFLVVLATTVSFLVWRQLAPSALPSSAPSVVVETSEAKPAPAALPSPLQPPEVPDSSGLWAFSGRLISGTDPSLDVGEGRGVLSLDGPSRVTVGVDGVDYGTLPLTLVLEEGRHEVQYRFGSTWTYRFYFVKSGATRELEVVTRPDGFVDAR